MKNSKAAASITIPRTNELLKMKTKPTTIQSRIVNVAIETFMTALFFFGTGRPSQYFGLPKYIYDNNSRNFI